MADKKKKGPIRTEAVIPTLIVVVLMGLYFKFFFDLNLKWAAEFAGTQVHGAEVNISKIRTSLMGGYMKIFDIQVTDKDDPKQNLIEIGEINFELLWDALLRGKFVINNSNIEGIKLYSPRNSPGRIVPANSEESKALRQAENAVLDQSKEQFNSNVLGDVANILGGTDADVQLKNIEGDLATNKRIKEIETQVNERKAYWDAHLKKLPDQKALDQLSVRYKKLKFDTKNTVQFLKDVQELDKILKEANGYYQLVNQSVVDLDKDFKKIDSEIKDLGSYVNKDMADLQKRMKIPSIDAGDFSKNLFGRLLNDKLAPYKKYIDLAQSYMPPKKNNNKKTLDADDLMVPKKRFSGQNHRFPITVSYPAFWLKEATISSKASEKGFSGNIQGSLTNLTTNQPHIGKPTQLTVKGDFPNQKIFGIDASLTIDHVGKIPTETILGSVESFPVGTIILSDSKDLTLHLKDSTAKTSFGGEYKRDKVTAKVNTQFNQVNYLVDSTNKDAKDIFKKAVDGIPTVNLNAKVYGPFTGLAWSITSNLGSALRDSIKKQINARLEAAKAKLRAQIEAQVAGNREKLNAEVNKVKSQLTGEMDKIKKTALAKRQEIDNKKNQAQQQENAEKKKAQDKVKKEGDKLLNDLKKKLKF